MKHDELIERLDKVGVSFNSTAPLCVAAATAIREQAAEIGRLKEDGEQVGRVLIEETHLRIAAESDLAALREKLDPAIRKLLDECEANRERWGDGHDEDHTPDEWESIIVGYARRLPNDPPMDYRHTLTKIAAVAVGAGRAFDRLATPEAAEAEGGS